MPRGYQRGGSRIASAVVLAVALACCGVAVAATDASVGTGPGIASLRDWDQLQLQLREAVWRIYALSAAVGPDARGRTVAQDLNEWVMPEEVRTQLRLLGSQAQRESQAGDEPAVRATLKSGQAVLQEQGRRIALIAYYWQARIILARQRDLWTGWLKQVPPQVAAESSERIETLEATLIKQYSPASTPDTLRAQVETLRAAYNSERIALAGRVSDERAGSDAFLTRKRTLPCPPPPVRDRSESNESAADTGGDRSVRVLSEPPAYEFYPFDARTAGISGKVTLRLTIAANGCMEEAQVVRSSGAAELDDAAIELSEYARFLPAERAGHPISSSPSQVINFQLSSDETVSHYIISGNLLMDQGDYDSAIGDFNQALALDPSAAMALADRGVAYAHQHRDELARKDLDAAFAIDAHNAVVFRGRGLLALEANDFAGAVAAFSTALQLEPQNLFSLEERAVAYWNAGDPDKALTDTAEAIRRRPSGTPMYTLRAAIFRVRGQPDQSIAEAHALIAANPSDARAYAVAAGIAAASGNSVEAMQFFDDALRIMPSEAVYLTRASLRPQSDLVGRRTDIDAALRLNPGSVRAVTMLSTMQSEAGDYAGALATLGAALATHADDSTLLTARGIVYALNRQSALAQKDFEAARTAAMSPSSLNSMCWAMATAGVELATALADCEAAIAAAPLPAYLDSRGFALFRLGRYDEAIACYDAALKARVTAPTSRYGRGLAELREGKTDSGNADIKAALAADAQIAKTFAGYGVKPQD